MLALSAPTVCRALSVLFQQAFDPAPAQIRVPGYDLFATTVSGRRFIDQSNAGRDQRAGPRPSRIEISPIKAVEIKRPYVSKRSSEV
jgi:hypothetical protein